MCTARRKSRLTKGRVPSSSLGLPGEVRKGHPGVSVPGRQTARRKGRQRGAAVCQTCPVRRHKRFSVKVPVSQRLVTVAELAAVAGVPVALVVAYRRRHHPVLALAGAAVMLAEAAYGVWWYRIAFAPSFGEVWVDGQGSGGQGVPRECRADLGWPRTGREGAAVRGGCQAGGGPARGVRH
jgi:hypothetical protein